MAEIVVRRPRAMWMDIARTYRIDVDGKHAGTVANNGEMRIAVTPGRHKVRLQIDWRWSPELEVDVGPGMEHVLECGPNANPLTGLLYATIWRKKYLWLRESTAWALPAAE